MIFRPGTAVWVEHPDLAWAEAEVVSSPASPSSVNIVLSTGVKAVVDGRKVLPRDTEADLGGVDDMTKLVYLHEPGVLCNLARRYTLNEIYTYTGRILIAINPFAKLPHMYDMHMMEQYRGVQFGDLSPHVFAVADASYRAMFSENRSQSILVSGESGAGKTETTKLIMRYLTFVGGRATGDIRSVEQQVLESNPLLEAFGNARTVRNDNSSRFGKFVEIQFDKSGRISGAAVRTYLLERSRVVQISEAERNYHCFYQLCASGQLSCVVQEKERKFRHPISQRYLAGTYQTFRSPLKAFGQRTSFSHVDARYPAMLFKQQLTASLEKIFGLIGDNLKKEISPLLSLCIQAPKLARGGSGRSSRSPDVALQQPVPSFFIRKLVTQVFSFINVQLFNSMLLRQECFTFSNGEYVKSGLCVLEKWIVDTEEEHAGAAWDELKFIRQAVDFLIIPQKSKKTLEQIKKNICPALSVRQIYRLCTMYWDDKYGTHSVSAEVVAKMRDRVSSDTQNPVSNSFLLDDDLSIPFTTEEIAEEVPDVDMPNIEMPSSLRHVHSA